MRKIYLSIVALLLVGTSSFAGKVERATEAVSPQKAKVMEIDGDLGAGEFNITTDNIPELALFDIKYDERAVRYDIDYYEKGEQGFLTFESDRRNHVNFDGEENQWKIVLSTKYKTALNLDIGACEAKMDFGGLPLKELTIDMGAASGLIEFSKPNPIRLEEFKMDAGASSLDMNMIGNANFSRFEFNGGVGSFELDFRGEYKGESEISIEIGLGSAEITLPRNVPVRIVTSGGNWLSSIDLHGNLAMEIDDDEFETEDFKDAQNRIILNLEVGLGAVDLYWKQ